MEILTVDHIGIRVVDAKRAVEFYRLLGFEVVLEVDFDAVAIMRNAQGVELNLITNGEDLVDGKNILRAPLKIELKSTTIDCSAIISERNRFECQNRVI